jgi:1,2-diacylglycerol-3-alpha-glucose alpha-1,2-galactosyltransferase
MQERENVSYIWGQEKYKELDILIVGNPDSLFSYQLAENWQKLGANVKILTVASFYQTRYTPNGIEVLKANDYIADRQYDKWKKNSKLLKKFERFSFSWDRSKYKIARRDYVFESGMPSVTTPYLYGKILAAALKVLKPDFVFVQEAYTWGGLALFYTDSPVVLFPFGGDIYTHSQVSFVSHLYMKRALHKATLVMPSATSAVRFLNKTFGIPENKVRPVSWGVDRQMFFPLQNRKKELAREKWQIPADRKIIMNIRRFRPGWGALVALETFILMARTYPEEYHFVLLGGAGKDKAILEEAAERLRNENLTDRILLIEDRITLEEVSELMGISDVFVNLMTKEDMRSASILQGAAMGSVPVLIDQPEYRHMEDDGYNAIFVPENDPELIARELHNLCSDKSKMERMAAANLEYIRNKEDGEVQVKKILDVILAYIMAGNRT